ncbi:hypothetical protein AC578_9088 [Pseudocercospora eumusae]|uniref:Uncharacterized protein n=1 Tax=Pseudocercospora eumusae TaxID=321146 RepID=A0A139GTZ2_9PEZI|nr:hypothetical protein AC578_9088 [Pseudocercospora eumusae]
MKHSPSLPNRDFPNNREIHGQKFTPICFSVNLNVRKWQNKLKRDVEPSWHKMSLRERAYILVLSFWPNGLPLPGRKKGWKNATLGELASGKY